MLARACRDSEGSTSDSIEPVKGPDIEYWLPMCTVVLWYVINLGVLMSALPPRDWRAVDSASNQLAS